MTLIRSAIFAVYFLIASYAPAQYVIIAGNGGNDSQYYPPEETTASEQVTLAQYHHGGASFPSGVIFGMGPQSVLKAGSAFSSPGGIDFLVKTQSGTSWSAAITDMSLQGYFPGGDWTLDGSSNVDVNIQPQFDHGSGNNWTSPDLYGGAYLGSGGAHVHNVTFYGFPGTALQVGRGGSALAAGPNARLKPDISNISIRRAFRGVYYSTTDGTCSKFDIEACRDFGARFDVAVQADKIHVYGGGLYRDQNDTLRAVDSSALDGVIVNTGFDSPGIWYAGAYSRGTDNYAENYPIGVLMRLESGAGAGHIQEKGLYAHTNYLCNVQMNATQCSLSDAYSYAGKQGGSDMDTLWSIQFDTEGGSGSTFTVGETVTFADAGGTTATGTVSRIADPWMLVIRASGNPPEDNNTITGGTSAHTAQVGDWVGVCSGIWINADYNTVTNSTFVQRGQRAAILINSGTGHTISDCLVNNSGNSSGLGIRANATLTNCTIENVKFVGGAMGLDLVTGQDSEAGVSVAANGTFSKIDMVTGGTSRIGTGNYIDIRVDSNITKWARLPTGWNHTTPKNTTNVVIINGIRFYPPSDEF